VNPRRSGKSNRETPDNGHDLLAVHASLLYSLTKLNLFDLSTFSSFNPGNLGSLSQNDPLWRLNVSRRRAALTEESDQDSAAWRLRQAEFLFDTGAYDEAVESTARLLEGNPESPVAVQAFALRCRSEFLQGKGRGAKVHLDEFDRRFGGSEDTFVRATHALVHGAYLAAGATGEPDAFSRAVELFMTAAHLYESCEEIHLAIHCRIEFASTLASSGKYLRAIKEIEAAMGLAREHSAFYYTGRLLNIGCSAAADQGYRKDVEATLLRGIEWCEFVGDFWGHFQGLYVLGRLLSYQIPAQDPVAAIRPAKYFLEAIQAAERNGAIGLAAHATASLAWLYEKSGEGGRRQRLLDEENERVGGRRRHFDGMYTNSGDVVKTVNVRIASRLHDGIENHPDAFFIFDARRDSEHGFIDFLNEYRNNVGAKVLGLDQGSVLLYSEAQENPYLKGLAPALLNAVENRASFEDHYRFDQGEERFYYSRRIVPSGEGAILIVRDVTAEQRIEMALRSAAESAERSDRSKSEFIANMSHEIRTPINGVLGLARVLADTELNPIQRAYLDDIIGSGDILTSVIGNILDLSKMESLSMPLDVRPYLVKEIVHGTVRLFHGQAQEKGIVLSTHIDSTTPVAILADGPRIRQVVANLVGNAIKFTQRGSITVRTSAEGETMLIEVSDTGMGIPEDRLEAIFDRFQQASADSRVFGGTGLGLTISKGIVQLMGGTIEVRSKVGEGSRFAVRLPVVETTETLPGPQGFLLSRLDGARVLVVDDNRVNRMVSKFSLEKLGCIVTVATNGLEAIETWESDEFDAVLMDIRMPVMDGLAATREIRSREAVAGKRTPVVALTAGALLEERSECFEAGMDDYISKPFSEELLREVLSRWIPSPIRGV